MIRPHEIPTMVTGWSADDQGWQIEPAFEGFIGTWTVITVVLKDNWVAPPEIGDFVRRGKSTDGRPMFEGYK